MLQGAIFEKIASYDWQQRHPYTRTRTLRLAGIDIRVVHKPLAHPYFCHLEFTSREGRKTGVSLPRKGLDGEPVAPVQLSPSADGDVCFELTAALEALMGA